VQLERCARSYCIFQLQLFSCVCKCMSIYFCVAFVCCCICMYCVLFCVVFVFVRCLFSVSMFYYVCCIMPPHFNKDNNLIIMSTQLKYFTTQCKEKFRNYVFMFYIHLSIQWQLAFPMTALLGVSFYFRHFELHCTLCASIMLA